MNKPERVAAVRSLPPRDPAGHKGTYGHALVVAGSVGMSGAAYLAGCAALRGGAGLVSVACPSPILSILASLEPCYLTLPCPSDPHGRMSSAAIELILDHPADVVAVGPGIGTSHDQIALVTEILRRDPRPMVLDADGLNCLAGNVGVLRKRRAPTVLTPHPGEFSRLCGIPIDRIQADREEAAHTFAQAHEVVVALKGHGTVVADGRSLYVNDTGNPGMATGGSGDVLTGLLAALIGQGFAPFDAATTAVRLHGPAGDLARDRFGETSMTARDILEHLAAAIMEARGSPA